MLYWNDAEREYQDIPGMTPLHEPNRALTRHKLEAIAWEKTPRDYRGSSGSRRQVLINTTEGTTLVPLGELTDYQLRRYIGPTALEEAGDMRTNGRGIYHGTAAQRDDYVIHLHGGKFHQASRRYYVDRIDRGGTHTTIGTTRGAPSIEEAIEVARKDARTRGILAGVIFEQRGDEITQIGHTDASQELPGMRSNASRGQADEVAARELSLYIENEYSLIGAPNSQGKAIEKNLEGHLRRGNFDLKKAEIAYMHLMESGAKKYAKEFASERDWHTIFNVPTRELVAHEFATTFAEEHGIKTSLAPNAEIEVDEFDAPAHWASAFINGDTSGLEEEELAELEAWQAAHPELGWVVDVSEETHFGRWNGLQTELATYTVHLQKGS